MSRPKPGQHFDCGGCNVTVTPWGAAQSTHVKAKGITFYSTTGHGGYKLSDERHKRVRQRFGDYSTFAGGPWYEEDQDVTLVVLTFPDEYEPDELRAAIRSARGSARPFNFAKPGDEPNYQRYPRWEKVVEWLDSTMEGGYVKEIVARWEAKHGELWESGGGSSMTPGYPPRSWQAHFTRVGDGAKKTVVVTDYAAKRFYTDEELAAVTAVPLNF